MRFQELSTPRPWSETRLPVPDGVVELLSRVSSRYVRTDADPLEVARELSPLPTLVCVALLCATTLLRCVLVETHARRSLRLHKRL